EGGLFKSTDGGENWTLIFKTCMSTLLIDPTAPATIYAGTQSSNRNSAGVGVYMSTNGGARWTAINDGLDISPEGVYNLALHPSSPSEVYASTASGIFKSANGGTRWTLLNTRLAETHAALAIDPSAPATLYAGTNRGVFKSTDGGAAWNASN